MTNKRKAFAKRAVEYHTRCAEAFRKMASRVGRIPPEEIQKFIALAVEFERKAEYWSKSK